MANLVIPRREIWTRQPAGAIEIDWNNPLSVGLVFDVGAYSRMCNTAIKKPTQTTAGSYQHSASAYGQSVTMASAVHSYGADDIFGGSDQATFQIIELPNNLTQASGIINKRNVALGANAFSLGYNYTTGNEFSVEFGNSSGVGGSVGASYSFSRASFSTLGNRLVCRLVGSAASQQKIQLWRNGLPVSIARAPSADNIITGIYGGIAPLDIGRVNNGTLYYGGKIVLIRMWRRALSNDEIQSIDENPWQIFAPRETRLFIPVSAGGSTLNASASGTAQASGAASLAAQIALAAVGVSTASGAANASGSSNIHLSATGLSVSSGTANPSATITISAVGLAQAAGQAGLAAGILLAGAGAARAAGNAALATKLNALASGTAQAAGTANLTGGAPGALSATGQAQATGSATLKITIALQAIGAAQATGTAQLTSGTQGQITATGQSQATGTAYPTVKAAAQAAGQAQASGSAAATTQTGNQITGLGHADASGTATLSVIATLTAAGFVRAMGAGGLNIEVPLAATGLAAASGSAALAIVPDYIPQAPLQILASVRHLARLNHAVSRQLTLRHKVTRVIH